jgi:hypothetical protein
MTTTTKIVRRVNTITIHRLEQKIRGCDRRVERIMADWMVLLLCSWRRNFFFGNFVLSGPKSATMMTVTMVCSGGSDSNQPGWWRAALSSSRRKEQQGQGQGQTEERSNRCGWLVVVLFCAVVVFLRRRRRRRCTRFRVLCCSSKDGGGKLMGWYGVGRSEVRYSASNSRVGGVGMVVCCELLVVLLFRVRKGGRGERRW